MFTDTENMLFCAASPGLYSFFTTEAYPSTYFPFPNEVDAVPDFSTCTSDSERETLKATNMRDRKTRAKIVTMNAALSDDFLANLPKAIRETYEPICMKQPNMVFLHMFDWFIMVSHLVLPAARGRVERCHRNPPPAACAAVDAWGEVRRRCRHRDTPHRLLLPLKKFGADPLLVVVSPPPPLPQGGRHPPPRRSRPPFQSDDLLLSLPPSLPPESRGVRLHGEGIVLPPPITPVPRPLALAG